MVTRGQVRPKYTSDAVIGKPVKAYAASLGILSTCVHPRPLGDSVLKCIITRLPRNAKNGGRQLTFIADVHDEVAMLEHFNWKDARPLFAIDTKHLWLIQGKPRVCLHVGVQKWNRITSSPLVMDKLLEEVWQDFRALKINYFLWQLLYRILATNI